MLKPLEVVATFTYFKTRVSLNAEFGLTADTSYHAGDLFSLNSSKGLV